MRKLKLFFYPFYLITILFVIILSIDVQESILILQKMGLVRYFSDLPYLGRNLLLFMAFMMITEFVLQNVHLKKLKKS